MTRTLAAYVVSCLALAAPAIAGNRCDLDGHPGAEVLVRYPLPDPDAPQDPDRHTNDHIPYGFAPGPVATQGNGVGEAKPMVIGIGDFFPGGPCDLLWEQSDPNVGQTSDREIKVAIAPGMTMALPPEFDAGVPRPPREWEVGGVYDLTGDGRADVLWLRRDTGGLMLWVRTADGWTVAPVSGGLPPQPAEGRWPVSAIVRFETDGPPGIIAQDGAGYRYFRAWWSDGSLRLESAGFVKGLNGTRLAAVGDFDGDGQEDLLQQGVEEDPALRVCYMDGRTVRGCSILTPPTFYLTEYPLGWFVAGPR